MKKSSLLMAFTAALFLLTAPVCFADTLDNLASAYKNEGDAEARYLAFARKANEEGYDIPASLFKAVALAEQVHHERYAGIIKKLGGTLNPAVDIHVINGTEENLKSAFKEEAYARDVMYPAFLKQAEKENIKDAIDVFRDAIATEGIHAELFAVMLNNLTLSKGLSKDFLVCPVCGNVDDVITTELCPVCSTETKKFKMVK